MDIANEEGTSELPKNKLSKKAKLNIFLGSMVICGLILVILSFMVPPSPSYPLRMNLVIIGVILIAIPLAGVTRKCASCPCP